MTLQRSTRFLALGFLGSGAVHLARPAVYEPMMPAWVPAHREVILGSGVAEIVLGLGLLAPPTRRLAGWGSVALLLGVFPANLKMAADAMGTDNTALKVGTVARLPGQWPMVKAALAATRGD
ncbi:DoxX family protein [Nocardioides rubriscoriae]|uniref:DoxX family protein n=1 Tax=Nocardioides rubriscoriae TaxID=642762 RepID=UPI0011E05C1A|nr:hypothetical protein [Nocardioides rubriscoriae]